LADWFAYPSSWPSPNVLKSFVRWAKVPPAQLTFMDFARIALGLDKAKAKRGTHTCIISGSFPLDVNKQIQQTCASPHSQSPQIYGFSCALHAYVLLHAPRLSLLSDVLFSERLARQGPFLPPLFFHFPLSCQSPKCLHKQPVSLDDDCGVPQPSLLLNH